MRITIFCLILSIFLVAADAQSQSASNEVLVKFKPGTAAQSRASAHQAANAQVTKVLSRLGVVEVEVQVGSVQAAVAIYSRNPNVEYAEPNHRRLLFRPVTTEGSEPSLGISNNFEEQWGLNNTGQAFGATVDPLFGTLIVPAFQGSAGADINAPEGWGVD